MQTSQQHVGSKGASQQYLGSKGASQQHADFTTARGQQKGFTAVFGQQRGFTAVCGLRNRYASFTAACGPRQRPNDVNFSVTNGLPYTVHAGFKAAYEFHDKHTLIDYFPESP